MTWYILILAAEFAPERGMQPIGTGGLHAGMIFDLRVLQLYTISGKFRRGKESAPFTANIPLAKFLPHTSDSLVRLSSNVIFQEDGKAGISATSLFCITNVTY